MDASPASIKAIITMKPILLCLLFLVAVVSLVAGDDSELSEEFESDSDLELENGSNDNEEWQEKETEITPPAVRKAKKLAESHLSQFSQTEAGENWRGAILHEPVPFHRLDLVIYHNEPHYLQFPVHQVDGRPAGFIVVTVGQHDTPITAFHTHGLCHSEKLRIQAQALNRGIYRIYHLDPLSYVAEDPHGRVAGHLSHHGAAASAIWSQYKAHYPRQFRQQLMLLRDQAHDYAEDTTLGDDESDSGAVERVENEFSAFEGHNLHLTESYLASLMEKFKEGIHYEDYLKAERKNPWGDTKKGRGSYSQTVPSISRDQPSYSQWDMEPDPDKIALSGCGPTAWAMLFGLYDNDPAWNKFGSGLLDQVVGLNPKRWSKKMPLEFDDEVKPLITELRADVKTFVVPFMASGDAGTAPTTMKYAQRYFDRRFMSDVQVKTKYSLTVGLASESIRDVVIENIKEGRATVVGVGFIEHYVLAREYWWNRKHDEHYIFINQGWNYPDANGWIVAHGWFAGWIE